MSNHLIIIPSLEPDEHLLNLISELRYHDFHHIVVVDDGSGQLYQRYFNQAGIGATVYHHSHNLGKGQAIKTAIAEYPTDEITGYITCDSDGQHSVSDIIRISKLLDKSPDKIILGTRDFHAKDVPMRSRFGNEFSSLFFHFRTGLSCPDTQTGLRAFSMMYRDFALQVPGERYEYEMNFLMTAAKHKYALQYLKIQTIYNNQNQGSHFHTISDSYRIYREPCRYVLSSLTGAACDVTTFTILVWLLSGYSWTITAATVIARVFSGLVNFAMNKKWSFESQGHTGIQMMEYFILFLGVMGLSSLFVTLLSIFPINITILKMLVDVALFLVSYSVQSKFIFTDKAKAIQVVKNSSHLAERS